MVRIFPLDGWQIGELVPVDFGDFLPCARFEIRVHGYPAEDIQEHALLAHSNRNALHLVFREHQAGFFKVIARLLVDFSYGAFQIRLVLVDLTPREAPFCALLPSLYQHSVGHVLVEHDGASDRHAGLVVQEVVEGLEKMVLGEACEERAVGKHALREATQVHGGQVCGVQGPNEVFVEPLRLLDLEADALHGLELFVGQVHDEADAEVVEPVKQAFVRSCHCESGRCRTACLLAAEARGRGAGVGRGAQNNGRGLLGRASERGLGKRWRLASAQPRKE